jgi:hypothetical protein
MSLFDILGTEDIAVVGRHLKDFYVDNKDETSRRAHAAMLDEFYAGKGDLEMERVIELLWQDKKNQNKRKAVLKAGLDKYDNVIARIAQEKATVYNEPTRRKVSNATNDRYQEFLKVLPQDAVMSVLDTKLAIHEDALLWYRVRKTPTGDRQPVLEVVSPASFWAICHPKDRTMLVGVILDQRMPMAKETDPSYRVWTDDQTFVMNAKCEIFEGSIESWPLGMMPGVLCSLYEPGTRPTLLAECPSIDLLSAQKAVRLQDLNLAKESVSNSRQNYVTGDTSATAMGQTGDTDSEIFLGEGVTVSAVDRGIDTEQFRDNAAHAADSAGANHGVPPTVRSQKDASSGAEIEMRRIPIRELRKKRIPIFRRIEERIARVMSMVNGARETVDETGEPTLIAGDLPEYAFEIEGWSIDFGEVQQPMTQMEALQVFEKARELGVRDNYEQEMYWNPDIKTIEEARVVVDARTKRRTEYVQSQKDLLAASGALGAAAPKTPFEANRGQPQDATDGRARFGEGDGDE